jgi:putative Holliday junction resolvase
VSRILAVDYGTQRIGLALSDPTGTLARPLAVLDHVQRQVDAAAVAGLAREHEAVRIVVGQSLDEEGKPNFAGRQAARFAEALRTQSGLPVELWDEAFTTRDARQVRLEMGVARRKRAGHLDDLAATLLLQSYLEGHSQP